MWKRKLPTFSGIACRATFNFVTLTPNSRTGISVPSPHSLSPVTYYLLPISSPQVFLQQLQLHLLHIGVVNSYLTYPLHAAAKGFDVELVVVGDQSGALGVFFDGIRLGDRLRK